MAEPDPNRWKALTIVCAAFFMTVLDVSIVNVALPSIGKSLHFSGQGLQWVITAYAITFGGFLLLGGRAADLLGRRRVFYVGVARLHDRVVRVRARLVGGRADRRARRAGPRRGDHHAGRALDHHDELRGGRRSETRRSASGARSAAPAPQSACSPAASSRSTSAGSGSSSSTSRSALSRSPWRRGSCARAAPSASRLARTSPARSRSPPASRCSSTPSRGAESRLGSGWTISRLAVAAVAAARVPRDRVARRRIR